jgi:hypothetical protein
VAVGLGAASVADIDRLNIYHATHLAMRRAIARLGGHDHVLVDGNRIAEFEAQVGPYTAIVDGDALVYSISCASVVAKTVRDRMMHALALRYPEYGWERNAGYATLEHREAIKAHGLTPHHRKSWQALQVLLAGDQLALFGEGAAEGDDDASPDGGDGMGADEPAAGRDVNDDLIAAALELDLELDPGIGLDSAPLGA